MTSSKLWTEKFRPTTLTEYVFTDDKQKSILQKWVEEKSIPHCLFSGAAGTGKTTIAKILINELGVHEYDLLEINASRTNSIDDVRNKIVSFIEMMPFGEYKVVLLDEADYLSINSQAALRGLFEEYSTTARFILTCNYPQRIIPALHSRCQGFHIEKLDKVQFTERVAIILINEGIEFTLELLDSYVKSTYPDLRKCINTLQMNCKDNKLQSPDIVQSTADYKFEMVELFKLGKIREARKLLCSQVRPDEVEDIFMWLYQNIDIFGDNETMQEDIILKIKEGLVDHVVVSDPEINLSATLIKIGNVLKKYRHD